MIMNPYLSLHPAHGGEEGGEPVGQGALREPLQGQRPLPAQLQVHGLEGGAGAGVEVRLPDGHGDGRGQVRRRATKRDNHTPARNIMPF